MPEVEFIDSLDTPESELVPIPTLPDEPVPEVPQVPPAAEAAPAPEERPRDPLTGQFLPKDATPSAPVEPTEEAPKMMPLAAHLEERRQWRASLNELQERLAKLEKPAEAAPEPEVDFVEDPKGYVDTKLNQAQAALKEVTQKTETLTAEQQMARFQQSIATAEQAFLKSTPDYYEALGHMRQARIEQLIDLNPEATEQQVQEWVAREELELAARYAKVGKNPVEAAYKMATKTYGYRPRAQAPASMPTPIRPDVPKAPVADPSQTLGSTGGPAPDDVTLDDDPNAEFAEALAARFGTRR